MNSTLSKPSAVSSPMRCNSLRSGEFLSPLLSGRAERVRKTLFAREAALTALGQQLTLDGFDTTELLETYRAAQARTKRVVEMARHKYPYRGKMPAWVSAGDLD